MNKFGARWVTELPTVLWSLRTTPSQATGYTPFFMVYGSEAVLPTDLDYKTPRIRAYDEYHIRVYWAAVAHPHMNGQVERANGMVLQVLKPRIFNRLNKFGG